MRYVAVVLDEPTGEELEVAVDAENAADARLKAGRRHMAVYSVALDERTPCAGVTSRPKGVTGDQDISASNWVG